MNEIVETLALSRIKNISPNVKRELIDRYGSPARVFEIAKSSEAIEKVFGTAVQHKLLSPIEYDQLKKEIDEVNSRGIEMIHFNSQKYPSMLKNIQDPPLLIYKKGLDIPDNKLFIAVVGARKSTKYGTGYAYSISKDLARSGVAVVSGMARGVDAFAHKGCMNGGGYTVAVLGSGLCVPYPKQNISLFQEIVEKGTVISEFDLFTKPYPVNFPQRNRIISGLSHGVFVAEASIKSGARITARLALEQNRDVFALPGRADYLTSEGSNDLIRSGLAKLTMSARDILIEFEQYKEKLSFKLDYSDVSSDADYTEEEKVFVSLLKKGEPIDIDSLVERSGKSIEKLLDIILKLELKGVVSRRPGNMILKET